MKIIYFYDGLGNQMFQYSFYKKIKKKNKNTYGNLNFYKKNKVHNGYELKKIFNIDIEEDKKESIFFNLSIKKNIFQRIIYKILNNLKIILYVEKWGEKNIEKIIEKKFIKYYFGWWQSEKYFKDISSEISLEFKFPEFKDEKNIELKNKILNSNSVSIHIRRGDYQNNIYLGGLAPLFYYEAAIKYILKEVSNPVFYIFSNDAEWCKENLKIDFPTYYIDWNKGEESFRDMHLMSLCKHNIIPNSTFSWWGAWLNSNPNKIVIAPERWFNKCLKWNYSNIIPESWIKIKNY